MEEILTEQNDSVKPVITKVINNKMQFKCSKCRTKKNYQCKLIYAGKKFHVKNVELLQFAVSTRGLYQGDPKAEKW